MRRISGKRIQIFSIVCLVKVRKNICRALLLGYGKKLLLTKSGDAMEKVSYKKLRHAYILQTDFLSYRVPFNLKEGEVTGSLCEGCKTILNTLKRDRNRGKL